MDLKNFFTQGLKKTVLLRNGINFSHKGSWKQVYEDTVIDEWFVGDFGSAEYTINVDYDKDNKEIVKVLVVATPEEASVTVYGRSSTGDELLDVSGTVTNSKFQLILTPALSSGESLTYRGAKAFFIAQYFHNINGL